MVRICVMDDIKTVEIYHNDNPENVFRSQKKKSGGSFEIESTHRKPNLLNIRSLLGRGRIHPLHSVQFPIIVTLLPRLMLMLIIVLTTPMAILPMRLRGVMMMHL